MSMYLALFIVLGFFAIGDIFRCGHQSKASSVFGRADAFYDLFMTGLIPAIIIDRQPN